MKRFVNVVLGVSLFVVTSSAFALVDGELLLGKRWYEGKVGGEKVGMAAKGYTLAAHVDPIPLVPVAFGLAFSSFSIEKRDIGSNDKGEISEVGLDIMGWIPLIPIVTPYARFNYPFYSQVLVTGDDVSAKSKMTGFHLCAGVKYSPIPLMNILFEVGRSTQMLKADEFKVAGKKMDIDKSARALNANEVSLGVEVGI